MTVPPAAAGRRVLLLHGLWMPRVSMRLHARRLRRAGFDPLLLGYAAVARGPQAAVPGLIEAMREPCDVVAHSLGGLVVAQALREAPDLPVGRVVCLGTPLAGSAAAGGLARHPAGAASLGRSAGLLCRGCGAWTAPAALGVIAGSRPLGLGQFFGAFEGPGDGTVAVAETRVAGTADHLTLPTSHSGMLLSPEVTRQVIHFLHQGRFAHAGERRSG